MSVPNQKVIKVNKEKCDKQHLYAAINLDAMSKAMNDLTGEEFKVWCFFAKNQNNYQFELSPKAIKEFAGTSDKTYQRSIKQLIEKDYLVQVKGNIYCFYEVPYSQNDQVILQDENSQLGQNDLTNQAKMTRQTSQNDYRNTKDNTKNITQDKAETSFSFVSKYSESNDEFIF